MKNNLTSLARDYERIAHAIQYLETNAVEQPELDEIARHTGLSTTHFQRLFSRWVGISPKRFLQYLTLQHSRHILRESEQSLLDITHEAGMSSVSRLRELYVHCEAMTPAEYRSMDKGLIIYHGVHPTPFGRCLFGLTDKGVCGLLFVQDSKQQAIAALKRNWRNAEFRVDAGRTEAVCSMIFSPMHRLDQPLYVLIKGTPFQLKVWEALLHVSMGRMLSYRSVAQCIHHPRSARAVANAVANNPLHFLIPCHRVIQSSGLVGGYRAGPVRKKLMLGWEAAQMLPR